MSSQHTAPRPLSLAAELEAAQELAIRAGAILVEHFGSDDPVRWKASDDPVTAADYCASKMLVTELRRLFPQDGIISEEEPVDPYQARRQRVWFLDPLDGTQEFVEGCGEFSVLIGLAIGGVPKLGVIYEPASPRMICAIAGEGAFALEHHQRVRLSVSPETESDRVIFARSRSHHTPIVDDVMERMGVRTVITRGSLGTKVGMIARGTAHAYVHAGTRTYQWDTCAGEVILQEAGGSLTDMNGHALHYGGADLRNLHGVVASNGKIHHKLIQAAQARASAAGV
ncbi:MAG: 3'(2'),5'-bisphosphate nucleotidase CysQ [Acidobacteria bacterium]|nr:3'(2'),5'-bisphosphate nucleotidase CysQ [Acidobacteriota bacterium]